MREAEIFELFECLLKDCGGKDDWVKVSRSRSHPLLPSSFPPCLVTLTLTPGLRLQDITSLVRVNTVNCQASQGSPVQRRMCLIRRRE